MNAHAQVVDHHFSRQITPSSHFSPHNSCDASNSSGTLWHRVCLNQLPELYPGPELLVSHKSIRIRRLQCVSNCDTGGDDRYTGPLALNEKCAKKLARYEIADSLFGPTRTGNYGRALLVGSRPG